MSEFSGEFSNKVALVTGSSSGIGDAIARPLSALGASIVITSARSVEAGTRIAAELGKVAFYVQADISDKAAGTWLLTKAALNQMTRLLAKSCAPVRVNAVAPGLVETPWTRDWQAQHEAVKARAPLNRSAKPDDCVEATLGLLRSRYATGQIFVVDGGLSLTI
jgi:ketoreductase RED2